MKQKPTGRTSSSEKINRDIKRNTRKQTSAEEKIRIVLDGVRGEASIAELCRREGIAQSLYYKWSRTLCRPVRSAWPGTLFARPTRVTSRRFGVKPEISRKLSPSKRWNCGCSKKQARGWGRAAMRYSTSEKLEIIRLVERSHLPVKQTLAMLGIARTTF